MTAEKLTLYFNLFLAALIVLGALKGYIQGFKKSLFNLIKDLVFWSGFFLTADLFANFILNSEELFSLVITYVPVTGNPANLFELVQGLLVEFLGVNPNAFIDSTISFAFALVSIVLKLVYMILYHTVIKFLYWIVTSIIWKIINKKEIEIQYKEKKLSKGKIKRKKKKIDLRPEADGPRFLGLIFGAGRSMIGVTLIVSLIMSVVSFIPEKLLDSYSEDSNVTASNQMVLSEQNKGIVADALDGLEEYVKFVGDLKNSPFVKLVRTIKSGDQTIDLVLFDTVMNGNYEEYNIRTRESLSTIIEIGYEVTLIIDSCMTYDGQLDLNQVDFEHVSSLVEHVTDIDLLMDAIPAVVELGLSMDSVQEELPIPVDEELKDAIGSIDWENDIIALANVITILAELDDINQVIANPIELLSKENEKVIYDIIVELSNLTLVTEMLPTVVEYALSLEEVQQMIGNATVDLSNIVWKDELVQIAEIYSVFQTLTSDITSLLFVTDIDVEDVVDGINLNALNDLILKVFELGIMEELFEPIMDIVVSNIEDESIKEMLNFDVDNYEDWAKEFTVVIDIAKELLAGENPFKYGVDVNIIKNLNPETILKSEILSQVIVSALVDASNGEGVFAGNGAQELAAFIDVPSYLKDKNASEWYNEYDEDGKLVSKGQLHLTLEGLQSILPKDKESVMNVNDTKTLSYQVSGVENAIVTWSSSNPNAATINQNGVVTAIAPGHTVIFAYAANGKVYDMIDVVVKGEGVVNVEHVYIEGEENYEITIGLGQENRYFLSASTNLDATNQVLTWTCLDESIVKVSADGAIEGLQPGSAVVKAISNADPTKFATCTVTVVENLPDVIKVNKESLVGHPNKTFYVDASINDSKEGLIYTVIDPSVASVDENGFVTLLNEGETKLVIKNKDENITKEVSILVVSNSSPTGVKIVTGTDGLDVNSILSSLDEETIQVITDSDILTRSLSKILLSALTASGGSGGMEVHLPTSVIATDGDTDYIKKEEIKTILNILLEVDISAVLEGGDTTALLEDLNDDTVDKLLESKILSAFLSTTISSIGDGMIVVPSTAYESEVDTCYEHPTSEIKYLKNSEVKALVNMLKDYDLLSGEDIAIPLSEDNEELTELIESSDILRATLSKYVLELSEGSDGMIIVPDQAIEVKGDHKLLEVAEFKAVLDALYDLGIEEISSSLSLDINVGKLTGAVDSINDSIILRATITDLLTDVEQIIVPDQSVELNSYTVNETKIKVLKTNELESLVNALASVLGEDVSFEEFSLDLTVGTLKDSLEDIKSSNVLMATISDVITTVDAIIIPDQATDNEHFTVDNDKISVLYNDELDSLVNTLVKLLGEESSVESIELDLTVGDLQDSLSDIQSSKILMATISDKVVPLEAIVVPDQALDKVTYTVDNSSISVLDDLEFGHLVGALVKLLGEESSIDSIELNLTVGDLKDAMDDITSSKIVMATVSDKIVPLEGIIVPDQAVDKVNYSVDDVKISVLYEEEFDGLINTLVTLLGEETSVENIDLDLTIGDLKESVVSINNSSILRTTVSDKIIPLTAIVVPDQVIENDLYSKGSTYYPVLTKDELVAMVNALEALLGTSASINELELNLTVGQLNDSVDTINYSAVLRATISDKINDISALIKPDQVYGDGSYTHDESVVKVLKKQELKALTSALEALLGENTAIDGLSLNLTVGNLKAAVEAINASGILKTTVGDKIISNDALIIPDEVVDSNTYTQGSSKLKALTNEELETLVDTLVTLLGENASVDSLSLNLKAKDLKASIDDINASGILRSTISDKIISNSALITPDEAVEDDVYTNDSSKVLVLEENELKALITALVDILGENTELDSIDLDLSVGDLKDAVTSINSTKVIRATISDKINDISALTKPNEAYASGFSVDESPIKVLSTSELSGLVDALVALLGEETALDSVELSLTVKDLYDSTSSINNSLILRTTITEKIGGSLDIPADSLDAGEYYVGITKVDVLAKQELSALAKALVNILGGNTSLDSFEIPMDIFNSLLSASDNPNKNKLEQSLESVIIWDKISTMISESTGSLIVVPNDARVGNASSGRITVEEINSLMKALNVLGVGSIDSVSLNANFIFDLDDETKDAQGNTELTRTTIALEKSKILMASIPSLFEEGIASAYEDDISISFTDISLAGTLNAEETAYVTEGELVRLFRAARAANILKSKTLADLSGKISDPNSKVSEINSLFLVLYASEVLRPTVKQVLVSLTSGIGLDLNGVELTEETIPVILAKAAAINDLQTYATEKAMQNLGSAIDIYNILESALDDIMNATSVVDVESIYDNAINNINTLVA